MPRPTFDPIDAIKRLPWSNLLTAASVALVITVLCDWLLGFMLALSTSLLGMYGFGIFGMVRTWMTLPANQFVLSLLVSTCMGILALYLLEKRFLTTRRIDMSILWGLVGSLVLALFSFWLGTTILKFLGVPVVIQGLGLVGAHELEVVAIALGVFLYGKRHL
jgi:hypothetical protein